MHRFAFVPAAMQLLLLFSGPSLPAQASFGAPVTAPFLSNVLQLKLDIDVHDVDGDCFPEVLAVYPGTGSVYSGSVQLFENDGNGNLIAPTSFYLPVSYTPPKEAAFARLDGDHLPDMLLALDGSLEVRMNLGAAGWGSAVTYTLSLPWSVDMRTADMDGDGDEDVVVVTGAPFIGSAIEVFMSDGAGGLAAPVITGTATPVREIELMDVTADGLPDLLWLDEYGVQIFIQSGNGAGGFGTVTSVAPLLTGQITSFDVGDIGGNGVFDLVMGQVGGVSREPLPSGGYLPLVSVPGMIAHDIQLEDLDRDGDLDIVWYRVDAFFIEILDNQGAGSFSSPLTPGINAARLELGDLDKNGLPDLVIYDFTTQSVMGVAHNSAPGPAFPLAGLATAVGSGPFDGTPKTFTGGDTVVIGTDISHDPCVFGRPATLMLDFPPESGLGPASTPIGPTTSFPGLSIVNPVSTPGGNVYLMGDSLGFHMIPWTAAGGWIDLGFGSLTMGSPPFVATIPTPTFVPGTLIRLQAIYWRPLPVTTATLGLVATNEATLTAY